MSDSDDKLISFSDEVLKRTGRRLDFAKIAARNKVNAQRVVVYPESDLIVRLAMDILNLVTPHADPHPIAVIAALYVVSDTLSIEYKRKIGHQGAVDLVNAARSIANQYAPEFKDGTDGSVAGTEEDEPERKDPV